MQFDEMGATASSGFLPRGAGGAPLRQFSPPLRGFCPPVIWSENNRKISITKEICITIDLPLPRKNSYWKKACHYCLAINHCTSEAILKSFLSSDIDVTNSTSLNFEASKSIRTKT